MGRTEGEAFSRQAAASLRSVNHGQSGGSADWDHKPPGSLWLQILDKPGPCLFLQCLLKNQSATAAMVVYWAVSVP